MVMGLGWACLVISAALMLCNAILLRRLRKKDRYLDHELACIMRSAAHLKADAQPPLPTSRAAHYPLHLAGMPRVAPGRWLDPASRQSRGDLAERCSPRASSRLDIR